MAACSGAAPSCHPNTRPGLVFPACIKQKMAWADGRMAPPPRPLWKKKARSSVRSSRYPRGTYTDKHKERYRAEDPPSSILIPHGHTTTISSRPQSLSLPLFCPAGCRCSARLVQLLLSLRHPAFLSWSNLLRPAPPETSTGDHLPSFSVLRMAAV